ncbi:T6SS effector BTH_I2691 family protein [Massilia antarctica]|uniref:T6SS effector BTH_I2691 family protein n=1 Tax=Massilia antarctica TaxID=2765360 RepID=UPI00226F914D|nr:T6SS effector BTH_I2691 family protein [Massilia sp. H27-R4]MCY0912630.1 hypothetical protein [Massilia sp. H27-R4]
MKDCKFCDKKGLLILPLRYAAVAGEVADDPKLAFVPALPSTLGENVSDIAVSGAKYAPRMLRNGYVYVLIKRSGLLYWEGYLVIDNAYLYKFPIDLPPPASAPFSCDPASCGIDASMISVPNVESVEKIYLLFTPSPMTKRKLDEYKADPEGNSPGKHKMQTFDPKGWVGGSHKQKHSMTPEQLSSHVPEFMLFKQCADPFKSELGKLMVAQLFRMTAAAFDGVPAPAPDAPPPARLGALEFKMTRKKAAAFVIFDHIGVTQELNDFRNDAFKPMDDFMGEKERNVNNTYRLDVHTAIGQMRTAMENGVVADANESVEKADFWRRALPNGEPIFPDDNERTRRAKMMSNNSRTHPSRKEWEAKNPEKVTRLEDAREEDEQRLIGKAPENAEKMWAEKYAPEIDIAEMKRFNDTFTRLGRTARVQADARTPQHTRWLKSKRLLNAFDLYDSTFAPSGEAFRAQVVGCIFGMEGAPVAEAVLTEWTTATSIARDNLLLRAFIRNQDDVKKEAEKTFSEITALVVAKGALSAVPATSWQKAIKGFVGAVKSTDSALDEWMRNQDQSKTYIKPGHIANVEARFFYLVSTMTRSVTRKHIGGKLETAIVGRFTALMQSCMGDMAVQIEHDTLFLKINPEAWTDLKEKHANADKLEKASASRKSAQERRAYRQAKKVKAALQMAGIDLISDAQLKSKIQLAQGAGRLGWHDLQAQLQSSAEEHASFKKMKKALEPETLYRDRVPAQTSPTNNYHHVRLGGVLAAIESIALLNKLSSLEEGEWGVVEAEILASVLSIASIGLDMMYAFTKSVRELPKYAVINGVDKAADILRGGFKLSAGMLGAIAGGTSAILDWKKMETQKDPLQQAIILSRSISSGASALAGTFASYSYAEPLLAHLAMKAGRSYETSYILGRLAQGTVTFSVRRVLLLRVVAWLSWVGVAITVVDLTYSGYRWYMDATALERWFSHCVFRKNKSNQRYNSQKEELTELAKAQHPGQEYD